jgi:hypothetical protein
MDNTRKKLLHTIAHPARKPTKSWWRLFWNACLWTFRAEGELEGGGLGEVDTVDKPFLSAKTIHPVPNTEVQEYFAHEYSSLPLIINRLSKDGRIVANQRNANLQQFH